MESQVIASWKLVLTCDSVWPWLVFIITCDDLRSFLSNPNLQNSSKFFTVVATQRTSTQAGLSISFVRARVQGCTKLAFLLLALNLRLHAKWTQVFHRLATQRKSTQVSFSIVFLCMGMRATLHWNGFFCHLRWTWVYSRFRSATHRKFVFASLHFLTFVDLCLHFARGLVIICHKQKLLVTVTVISISHKQKLSKFEISDLT